MESGLPAALLPRQRHECLLLRLQVKTGENESAPAPPTRWTPGEKNQNLYLLVPGHDVALLLLGRPDLQPQAFTRAFPGSGCKAGIFL